MEYFGTDLENHGHYRWDISESCMQKSRLSFNDLPFDPEQLTNNLPKGQCAFYQGGGFTAIAISGSAKDDRLGTKSVFWVKEAISYEEMKNRITGNELAATIIKRMPFPVYL